MSDTIRCPHCSHTMASYSTVCAGCGAVAEMTTFYTEKRSFSFMFFMSLLGTPFLSFFVAFFFFTEFLTWSGLAGITIGLSTIAGILFSSSGGKPYTGKMWVR